MESGNIRPGKQWYALSVFILIVGIAVFSALLIEGISVMQRGSQRVVVPGTSDVTLSEQGKYAVYYEYNSVVDGEIYVTGRNLSGLRCTLKDKATGQNIEVSAPSIKSNYSFKGYEGVSVLEFTIPKAGTYELNARYGENKQGQEVVLAINKGLGGKTVFIIIMGIIVFFSTLALAIIIFVLTIVKRRKAIDSFRSADFTEKPVL
jgi:hypothetical protein